MQLIKTLIASRQLQIWFIFDRVWEIGFKLMHNIQILHSELLLLMLRYSMNRIFFLFLFFGARTVVGQSQLRPACSFRA